MATGIRFRRRDLDYGYVVSVDGVDVGLAVGPLWSSLHGRYWGACNLDGTSVTHPGAPGWSEVPYVADTRQEIGEFLARRAEEERPEP